MESCLRGYVRRSWAMRFICLALPVLINLRTGRTVDSAHGKPSNSILTRDCSSAIFMLSAGLLLSRWLEANIRFYEDRSETKERTESEAKNFETMMIGFVKILSHVVFCDLSLRLIWLPLQWFLYWITRMNVLATLVKVLLFFVKDFSLFRPLFLKLVAASSTPKAFIFLRILSALIIFDTVVSLFGLQPVSSTRKSRITEPPQEPPAVAASNDKTDPRRIPTTA
uniref:Uncharacterized protein n=1 Tax=Anopheles atroparvus TaxID=41427 RepID=A0AAG5DIS5_ANOAO